MKVNKLQYKRGRFSGFAIALAWPQTLCKQPGSWYDGLMRWLSVSRNYYYRAGHAAMVLVDIHQERCHYFDFGRYHAPYQFGRVRSADTDFDLKMYTIPKVSADGEVIENFKDILRELQNNSACHGEGELHAAYCSIDYSAAYAKAIEMQLAGMVPYGPFRLGGSNCSRFVNSIIRAGRPGWNLAFRLKYLIPFSPMPLNNVNSLHNKCVVPIGTEGQPFLPIKKMSRELLRSTLQAPPKHSSIPEKAQWLSGEGVGSWFDVEVVDHRMHVNRFSSEGVLECSGVFLRRDGNDLSKEADYRVIYPSNCKSVCLDDGDNEIICDRIAEEVVRLFE